jgi:hypothetical protein
MDTAQRTSANREVVTESRYRMSVDIANTGHDSIPRKRFIFEAKGMTVVLRVHPGLEKRAWLKERIDSFAGAEKPFLFSIRELFGAAAGLGRGSTLDKCFEQA